MAISRAQANLCDSTVNIAPFSSYNSYGEPSFGANVAYSCLIEKKPRMVRSTEGKEVVSSAAIYLTSAPTLTTKYRVTLPDSTTPQILSLATYPSGKEANHYTIIYV